jgi:predicted small lipoprotein YifL
MSEIIVGQITESHKIMKMRTYSVGLALLLAGLLSGCGLKGPLYMPQQKPAQQQTAQPQNQNDNHQTQS